MLGKKFFVLFDALTTSKDTEETETVEVVTCGDADGPHNMQSYELEVILP